MSQVISTRIPWHPNAIQSVTIPIGAKIFHVSLEPSASPRNFDPHIRIWYLTDTPTLTERDFVLVHEGGDVPARATFIGFFHFDGRSLPQDWFVFDLGEAAP